MSYPSVLFILKCREQSWGSKNPYGSHPSGLLNSATFVNKMLVESGVKSNLVEVFDGNDIDREVVKYQPEIVILEAVWCPPSKLRELTNLARHDGRTWVVRNHSELPFLSLEGISMQWVLEYANIPSVIVACNSPVATDEFYQLLAARYDRTIPVIFFPNYYGVGKLPRRSQLPSDVLNVGCFGAIRPLKNHAMQAVAAIMYASQTCKRLRFHINASRVECHGDPVLKSLRALFDGTEHELVEHGWLNWPEFVQLCKTMDLGMQVSFSESFNLVSADLVSQGVPVVTSDEVPWMPEAYHADPTSMASIVEKMYEAYDDGATKQAAALRKYSQLAKDSWLATLENL